MLQQTQVARVVERFEPFVAQFPSVRALAEATEREVLAQWQGLGYYQRARRLQAAATVCVRDHGGRVPRSAAQLVQLPGIGKYTAGAIASIVFGERAPIVDGNVARVLLRIHGQVLEPTQREAQAWLWAEADAMVHAAGDAAVFNEALMELGALVCTPRAPNCDGCPWKRACVARAEGTVASIPVVPARAVRPTAFWHTVVMADARGLVLEQRGERGLWVGLWQTPTIECVTKADADAFGSARAWPRARNATQVGRATAVTSSRRVEFGIWVARVPARIAAPWTLVPWSALPHHAMSNAMRKVLEVAGVTPTAAAQAVRSRAAHATQQTQEPEVAAPRAGRARLSRRPRRAG